MNYTKNLIEAMINYGEDNFWDDSTIIETLLGCGITKQDIIDCGYWNYARAYFEND